MAEPGDANSRWAHTLAGWAIPQRSVATAPEPPYFFDPQVFIAAADQAISRANDTPSDAAARDVLPPEGTVLDVACGAGAASLGLHPARVTGVDPSTRQDNELRDLLANTPPPEERDVVTLWW
jgi:hypothetical protein